MEKITPRKKILRLPEVIERVGYCRSNIYLLMEKNLFPKSVKLGQAVGWIESEIDNWIESKIQERDQVTV